MDMKFYHSLIATNQLISWWICLADVFFTFWKLNVDKEFRVYTSGINRAGIAGIENHGFNRN
jgi:hypothetical protein